MVNKLYDTLSKTRDAYFPVDRGDHPGGWRFMVLFAIGAAVLVDRRTGIAIGTIYGPPFLLFGGVFFGLSRKLAGWVCHDFDKELGGEVEKV